MLKNLSKEEIINGAVDLFGYASTDLEDMSRDELLNYLENDLGTLAEYLIN